MISSRNFCEHPPRPRSLRTPTNEVTEMVTTTSIARILREISTRMIENRDHLVKLDQVNGDGDLGISMDDGFRALTEYFEGADTPTDLGAALRQGAKVLNSSAPSSLGTILSFGLMGMAKALRGKTSAE